MRYVQLVLTDVQVGLLAGATKNAITDAGNEQEAEQLAALVYFLDYVDSDPTAFPVTGKELRRSIRKNIARAKGPAQPKRANARKRTQARKIGFQKRTRAMKREEALAYNAALEALAVAAEIEQAQAARDHAESIGIVLPE